jgi:hypothetical protein
MELTGYPLYLYSLRCNAVRVGGGRSCTCLVRRAQSEGQRPEGSPITIAMRYYRQG